MSALKLGLLVACSLLGLVSLASDRVAHADCPSGVSYEWSGAYSTHWLEPRNWNPQGIPAVCDSVTIDGPGTVVVSGTVGVRSVAQHDGTLAGGEITVGRAYTWTGGTLSNVVFNVGSWDTPASVTVTMAIGPSPANPPVQKTMVGARLSLGGRASATMVEPTEIYGGNDTLIANEGSFQVRNGTFLPVPGGGRATFANSGTLTSEGTTTFTGWDFNNEVTVSVKDGLLNLGRAGNVGHQLGGALSGPGRMRLGDPSSTASAAIHAQLSIGRGSVFELGDNGVLVGDGRFGGAGTLEWTGGTIGGSRASNILIYEGVTFSISGSSPKRLVNSMLNDEVTTVWTGSGQIVGGENAEWRNGGTLDIRTEAGFSAEPGLAKVWFGNGGTVKKTSGLTTTMEGWSFFNSGLWGGPPIVDVQVGTLQLGYPGNQSHIINGGFFRGAGRTRFADAARTVTVTLESLAFIEGGGTVELGENSLLLGSGMLNSDPELGTGTLNWTGGRIGGPADTQFSLVETGLNISGSSPKHFAGGSLILFGPTVWTGSGAIVGGDGARIVNASFAGFDIQNDARLAAAGAAGWSFFNPGLLKKSSGSGATVFERGVAFRNGFYNTDVGVEEYGTVVAASGTISSSQDYTQAGGSTLLAGGSLGVGPGGSMKLQGGVLAGSGTLTGTVVNSGGTVSLSTASGPLSIVGDYTQGPTGTLSLQLAGKLAGMQHSRLDVSGAANLGGQLQITTSNAFTPTTGDAFKVLSFGTRTGDFANSASLRLRDGRRLLPLYAAQDLTLAVDQDRYKIYLPLFTRPL